MNETPFQEAANSMAKEETLADKARGIEGERQAAITPQPHRVDTRVTRPVRLPDLHGKVIAVRGNDCTVLWDHGTVSIERSQDLQVEQS